MRNVKFNVNIAEPKIFPTRQILPKNFERGIRWIRDLLFSSSFVRDRLKIVVRKLISSVSQIRRQGNVIIDMLKIMIFHSGAKDEFMILINLSVQRLVFTRV